MKPSKTLIVAVALALLLFGASSLIAKDGAKSRITQKPDAGDAYDPGPTEGDPWQDDDDGGMNFIGGGRTRVVILPGISLPFHGFQALFITVSQPTRETSQKISIPKNSVLRKIK